MEELICKLHLKLVRGGTSMAEAEFHGDGLDKVAVLGMVMEMLHLGEDPMDDFLVYAAFEAARAKVLGKAADLGEAVN